ncbi:MAG: Acylamidase, partial [Pseudomonadota bacterium]
MLHSSQNINEFGALDLSRALHTQQFSCRELMLATLAQLDRLNPGSHAVVSRVDSDALLAQADLRDAQLARGESMGWMHGIPQAIKDLANVQGLRTTLGSPLMKDFVASEDGLMAQRMKAAGAIVIGKTNTPEFGLGSHTFNEVFGPTRNAWDPSKSAGGSSGGAAVALAQRMLPVADGSDFMGSLRNPAGWNHVFGLRPSQGRVPMSPAQDVFMAQLATEGPMGRHVRDVAMLLSTQAGAHPSSPLSLKDD